MTSAKWRLSAENSILLTYYYPNLGSASDWSCRVGNFLRLGFFPSSSSLLLALTFCSASILLSLQGSSLWGRFAPTFWIRSCCVRFCGSLALKEFARDSPTVQKFLYCAFQKHANSEAKGRQSFSLPPIILADLLGNRTLLWRCSKGHGLWFLIGGFRFILFLSVFQGSLLVIVIWLTAAKNAIEKAAVEL